MKNNENDNGGRHNEQHFFATQMEAKRLKLIKRNLQGHRRLHELFPYALFYHRYQGSFVLQKMRPHKW